jgi:DNA (cytosine-5)-methyltransferase 1
MKFLSLFSGIEAASVAWNPLGWHAVAFCEIDPPQCAVLHHHYANTPNIGDITQLTQQQINELGQVDLVVGGFPCQDLSLAGARKGLKNADGTVTRSGLFYDAMRVAEWAKSRWLVIENVFGLLTSNEGRDFAAVVGEMAGCGFDVPNDGWRKSGVVAGPKGLVEWTVLDAQYHGLPQRRRRIFIVRDSGDWPHRQPLFLDTYRLRGNTAPSREAKKDLTRTTGASIAGGVQVEYGCSTQNHEEDKISTGGSATHGRPVLDDLDVAPTLDTRAGRAGSHSFSTSGGLIALQTPAGLRVRRYMPIECERLMGLPDNYTAVPFGGSGKITSDRVRYKAIGNSMAVPVMRWIGETIQAAHDASHDFKTQTKLLTHAKLE